MNRKGITLALTLFVVLVAVMFAGTLIGANKNLLFFSASSSHSQVALAMAQSGLNRVINHMNRDLGFASSLEFEDGDRGYSVAFGAGQSVNNLANPAPGPDDVPANSALVVAEGRSAHVTRRIRAIVRQGILESFGHPSGAQQSIGLGDQVQFDGIKDLLSFYPVPGGAHSNLSAPAPGQYSFEALTSATAPVVLGKLSTVQPQSGAQAFDPAIALPPSERDDNAPSSIIPDLDVNTMVTQMSGLPPAPPLDADGRMRVDDEVFTGNDLVLGPGQELVLANGAVYVGGDAVLDGRLRGIGKLVVRGNVTYRGTGLTYLGNTGVSILAGGTITLDPSTAAGPSLDSLGDPASALRHALADLSDNTGSPTARSAALQALADLRQVAAGTDLDDKLGELEVTLRDFFAAEDNAADDFQLAALGLLASSGQSVTFPPPSNPDPTPSSGGGPLQQFLARNRLLTDNQLLRRAYQGVAYARGSLTSVNGVDLLGSFLTLGQAHLANTHLTFNQSYVEKEPGVVGLVYVVSYEEQ